LGLLGALDHDISDRRRNSNAVGESDSDRFADAHTWVHRYRLDVCRSRQPHRHPAV
jgi:hypothetical protein